MLSVLLCGLSERTRVPEGGRGRTGLPIKTRLTLLAAQLQHTALVQSKYHSVEGELNHFTAIKKPNGDIEMNLQYVSFTICIPTRPEKKKI